MTRVVPHGGYGARTDFNVNQLKYVGGEGGYCEMVHVLDPLICHHPFLIVQYSIGKGYRTWEFTTLERMMEAWPETFPDFERIDKFASFHDTFSASCWVYPTFKSPYQLQLRAVSAA